MAKQDFLQLAQKYTEKKSIGGFCYSEKLDGFRVFWDGGVTTGMHSSKVPWANTTKDHIHAAPSKSFDPLPQSTRQIELTLIGTKLSLWHSLCPR